LPAVCNKLSLEELPLFHGTPESDDFLYCAELRKILLTYTFFAKQFPARTEFRS
jgi:hypothetical protein